jgi:hypothetical protein
VVALEVVQETQVVAVLAVQIQVAVAVVLLELVVLE